METFMQQLRAGKVSPYEIDTVIDAWHTSPADSPLSAGLGMTPEEYGAWMNSPNLRGWLEAIPKLVD